MTTELDGERVEKFAGRIFSMCIDAGLAAMIDIGGHQLATTMP